MAHHTDPQCSDEHLHGRAGCLQIACGCCLTADGTLHAPTPYCLGSADVSKVEPGELWVRVEFGIPLAELTRDAQIVQEVCRSAVAVASLSGKSVAGVILIGTDGEWRLTAEDPDGGASEPG